MTWTEKRWRLRFCVSRRSFLRRCASIAAGTCVIALVLTAQGCSLSSSESVPTLPVLASLRRLSLEGTPGLWMSEDDAGRLAVWIYDVTGEDGR